MIKIGAPEASHNERSSAVPIPDAQSGTTIYSDLMLKLMGVFRARRTPIVSEQEGVGPILNHTTTVRRYLAEHPDIQRPLEVLCQAAVREFGANAELSVELFADPEESDEYLTLYVRQHEYADDLLDRIEAFDDEQGSLFDGCSASVLVNTDFQPPRA